MSVQSTSVQALINIIWRKYMHMYVTYIRTDVSFGSGEDAVITINMIEADAAKRILGVRLGLNGRNNTELEYILQETTILARRIN